MDHTKKRPQQDYFERLVAALEMGGFVDSSKMTEQQLRRLVRVAGVPEVSLPGKANTTTTKATVSKLF